MRGILEVPRILIAVPSSCGWKNLSRVWFASCVSRSLYRTLHICLVEEIISDWFCCFVAATTVG